MEFLNSVHPVIALFIGILSVIGAGGLIKMGWQRRWSRKDDADSIHRTVGVKQIEADINTFNLIYERVSKLEDNVAALQSEITNQKVENAHLEGENNRLSLENERQETEIGGLRKRLHDLSNVLNNKNLELQKMSVEFEAMKRTIAVLTERFSKREDSEVANSKDAEDC